MRYIVPSANASFADRLSAAWHAFKMKTKPDVQVVLNHLNMIESKQAAQAAARQVVFDKLDGYDKSLIISIAADLPSAENLLRQVMPAIERLDTDDQLTIIKHIIKSNPRLGRSMELAPWIRQHINDIFNNLPE